MNRAYRQVVSNKGAPGVDGMTVGQLRGYLDRHWPKIEASLLDGSYEPMPAMRKEIDKPDGGVRLLGIPTVLDRLIQQAIAQVLEKLWDHTFSESSFGFRPGRGQRDAIRQCRRHVADGLRYCVDIDLSKFFDRVHHDRLMARLATKVTDKRVLKLIRKYLQCGVMIDGLEEATEEGTPQGGPLSPLLSNIVLDELDKELEKRELRFVRYADDCVVYVGSKRAGERVMKSMTKFITKRLRLKVNEAKSSVGRPWRSKYLGFSLTSSRNVPRIKPHWKSVEKLKDRIREITKRKGGRSLQAVIRELNEYLRGWWGYFGSAESFGLLAGLDGWIRRRLRSLVWKQWKNRRTRVRNLVKLGIYKETAVKTGCARKGAWRMSQVKWVMVALPKSYFKSRGLVIPWT
ncbi:MAG: group II intron reverse transcriptase/maturase [Verrucomicrobia bacterium]|nr:group II intron reverse transcriptase/maturase [Verrucomicrobiota bacterium]